MAQALRRLAPLNAVVEVLDPPVGEGPLAGVPVAVKDIIAVRGARRRFGTPAPDAVPSVVDATAVARLRRAGAAIVATTQCLEWAAGFANPEVGDTRNPRDERVTAGGSSGGSAAVVAAGVVPLALGSDTGGSVRIPAAYCGVPGIKPTYGAVPTDGVQPLSPSCDHVGLFATAVAGLALPLRVMAALPGPVRPRADPVTLGVLQEQFTDPSVTPEAARRFEAALSRLAAGGVQLVPMSGAGTAAAGEALRVIVSSEAAWVHRGRDTSRDAAGTRALLELGAGQTAGDLAAAHACRAALGAEVDTWLDQVDALLGPTVGFVAPPQDPPFGSGEDCESRFTGPYNLTGHPALSLPVDEDPEVLPLGLQLATRRGGDLALIGLGAHIERILTPGRPGPDDTGGTR